MYVGIERSSPVPGEVRAAIEEGEQRHNPQSRSDGGVGAGFHGGSARERRTRGNRFLG